jgi:hypothetical protein
MLGLISIQAVGTMQNSMDLKQPLRLVLLVNACVALVTCGATLVVEQIAPLGLAAVGARGGCSPWPLPIDTEPVTRSSLARAKGWSRRDV